MWKPDHGYCRGMFHRVSQQQSCDQFANADWLIKYELFMIWDVYKTNFVSDN